LIPEFFGVETIGLKKNSADMAGDYLVLQDITDSFLEPNIMDIKIGAKTYGPDASESKMAQEDAKYVGTKMPFGYSVTGLIVHSLSDDGIVRKFDKNFGKNLKSEDVLSIPEVFFDLKNRFVPDLLELIIDQITNIYNVCNEQRKYKMFASSVLLAYDAAAVRKFVRNEIDRTELSRWTIVRIIDFAHVFDAKHERDDNFLTGLENLTTLFKSCLNNRK
jgi:1D-myo-inositol-tetrakisphosphate 5-kinase/inositol-polyphosphate multikinase